MKTDEPNLFIANEFNAKAMNPDHMLAISSRHSSLDILGLLSPNDKCVLVLERMNRKVIITQCAIKRVTSTVNRTSTVVDQVVNDQPTVSCKDVVPESEYQSFHELHVSMQRTSTNPRAVVISWPNGMTIILRPRHTRSPTSGSGSA